MNKKLFFYTIIGILFVSITGTLLHFVYEWSGNNFFVGLIAPVNESIWEHVKLLFFPMLLYSLFMNHQLKAEYPCITSALLIGIIAGSMLIPGIFYMYTGILGFHLTFLDIAIFFISVIIAFILVYNFTLNCNMKEYTLFLKVTVSILLLLFFVFTYYPPHIALFASP